MFKQQMANLVVQAMEENGTQVLHKCLPQKVEKTGGDRLLVTWSDDSGHEQKDEFDSVLLAIGMASVCISLLSNTQQMQLNIRLWAIGSIELFN